MKISKVPIVILKGGDRQLTFYKVKKYASKYFAIKENNAEGMVFELDDRYEYRFNNTSIYFYNFSNFKPVSLTGVHEIDQKLRKQGKSQLENIEPLLASMSQEQKDMFAKDLKDPKKEFSPQTRRFLDDYKTDDEYAKTEMIISLHNKKAPITTYSSPLSGIGFNSGHYAIVQIGHKKLDIVPMYLYNNRAYTSYGVFNFTVDNLYLVKKQIVAVFILNDSEDYVVEPVPKEVSRQIKNMARKKQWSYLETFNKPKRTKIKHPKYGYQLKVQRVEEPEVDETVKAKIQASLKPKSAKKKVEEVIDTNIDDVDIVKSLQYQQPEPEQPKEQPVEEPIEQPVEEPVLEDEPELPEVEEEQVDYEPEQFEDDDGVEVTPSLQVNLDEATGPPEPVEEPEISNVSLELDEATGPPIEEK